jgi:HPt (histidine-containing phosphotransfer) domain-containing protein
MIRPALRFLARYALPAAAVAAAVLVTRLLGPSRDIPFTLFLVAVLLSAWYGGPVPALTAVVLSLVAVYSVFAPSSLDLEMGEHLLSRSVQFVLVSGLIIWLSESRRRAEEALRESERRLRALTETLRQAKEVASRAEDELLAEPIAAAALLQVLDRVLAGGSVAEPEPSGRGCPETLLDPATLRAACDDDETLLRELVQVFRADTPNVLARVRTAVDQRDASELRESAHALRGMLATFSATAAAEAARLETMGAGGQLDDAASTFDGLTALVERLGPQLEGLSIERLRQQAAGGGPV